MCIRDRFLLRRDRIPTFSVDAAYMMDKEVGYVKVTRFSESTYDEFKNAVSSLKTQGMKKLMLDLRGNPGGYMDRATNMVDELLAGDKLIVYTDGKDDRYDRQTRAKNAGMFENGSVVVPLSYTHLNVYKRQLFNLLVFKHFPKIFHNSLRFGTVGWYRYIKCLSFAVSKRQPYQFGINGINLSLIHI